MSKRKATDGVSWQVSLSGLFKPYESDVSSIIEAAFADGERSVEVKIRGTAYVICFTSMEQVQAADNTKTRSVQRVGPEVKKAKTTSPQAAPKITTSPQGKKILIVLPGASGKLATDMNEQLMPALTSAGFDVRLRPEAKWSGWNPNKNALLVLDMIPPECKKADAAPWYVMGCSFGNRVACAIVSDALTPIAPGLVLTGYPMYSGNGKEDRVKQIQKLPASARVLAISGEKDDYINKQVPEGKPKGRALWEEVISGMACSDNTTLKLVEKGGHGVYESSKSKKGLERKSECTKNIIAWMNEFSK